MVDLVDNPNILLCSFNKKFLSIPKEILILTMQSHQKYFPTFDNKNEITNEFLIVSNKKEHKVAEDNLKSFNRLTFSFPPDFGAAVVDLVLSECDSNRIPLVEKWKLELTDMRSRMLDLRNLLADSLMRNTNSNRFDFLANHRGMFSLLGLTPDQVMRLRTEHGIYMVGDSRINIAGLNHDQLEKFSVAVASVI